MAMSMHVKGLRIFWKGKSARLGSPKRINLGGHKNHVSWKSVQLDIEVTRMTLFIESGHLRRSLPPGDICCCSFFCLFSFESY